MPKARARAVGLGLAAVLGCAGTAPELVGPPGPAAVRLLSRAEYGHTIRDLLGVAPGVSDAFPLEAPKDVLLTSDVHQVNAVLVQRFAEAAESLAPDAGTLLLSSCASEGDARACAERVLFSFLERAFRRPPTSTELERFRRLFDQGVWAGGAREAMGQVVRAVLESPQFLYRIEMAGRPPRPHELAARLSYFLWNTMPDEALREAARANRLSTAADVAAQARRMLRDPRLRDGVRDFHRQWLSVDTLASVDKPTPGFQRHLAGELRDSLLSFAESVVVDGTGTLKELFTSSEIVLPPRLTAFYAGPLLGPRTGIITHPAMMVLLATWNQSSPVKRGAFIRKRMMCQLPPSPPADIAIKSPALVPKQTTRERFEDHIDDVRCARCHKLFEPIGFGLENYDELGRYRSTEQDKPIDVSGAFNGTKDAVLAGPFDGAGELARRLGDSPQVAACLVSSYFTYALGRAVRPGGDDQALATLRARFAAAGGNVRELLVAIAASNSFRAPAVVE